MARSVRDSGGRLTAEDDLLRPSLSRSDDIHVVRNPWRPSHLVVASFLVGPVGAGLLLGWNFERLGMRRHAVRCLLGFLALALVVVVTTVVLRSQGVIDSSNKADMRLARVIGQALTGFLAVGVSRLQESRFAHYE